MHSADSTSRAKSPRPLQTNGNRIAISPVTLNDITDELGRVCSAMFAITMAAQTLHLEEGGAIMQISGDTMNKIEAVRAKITNIVGNSMLKSSSPTHQHSTLATMSIDDLQSAESAILAARHIMLNEASNHTVMGSDDGLEARRSWGQAQFNRLDAELLALVLELDSRDLTNEDDKLTYVCAKASAFPHLADPDYGLKLMRAAS